MRRRLKLTVILPALFCGVHGLLWYWDVHSVKSIAEGGLNWDTPAYCIEWGLNFPATLVNFLIGIVWSCLTFFLPDLPIWPLWWLAGFLWVAGLWCLVGRWLDRRGGEDAPLKIEGPLFSIMLPALVFVFGALALWFSLGSRGRIGNFIQSIEVALIQTWAVFLMGIPTVGILRYFLDKIREKEISLSTPTAPTRISDFRLLEMIVGVFAILVLLWLPPDPLFPPEGYWRAFFQALAR